MFEQANEGLEEIDPFNLAAAEVLAVRVAIYHGLKNGICCATQARERFQRAVETPDAIPSMIGF
jgi:hypothetical protein